MLEISNEKTDQLSHSEQNFKSGYIKIFRSIKDHWIWKKSRVKTHFEAWMDLLLKASHDDQKEPVGMDVIMVKKGQVLTSQLKLSKEWFWSRHKVNDFLYLLQKDFMIMLKSDTKWSMITICNYASYQDKRTTKGQQKDINGTSTGHIQGIKGIKDIKEGRGSAPSIEQVIEYFLSKGYSEKSAKKAFEFYNSNNWYDSYGKKVLAWKQKMISVWFTDENKTTEDEIEFEINRRGLVKDN